MTQTFYGSKIHNTKSKAWPCLLLVMYCEEFPKQSQGCAYSPVIVFISTHLILSRQSDKNVTIIYDLTLVYVFLKHTNKLCVTMKKAVKENDFFLTKMQLRVLCFSGVLCAHWAQRVQGPPVTTLSEIISAPQPDSSGPTSVKRPQQAD